MNNENNDHYLYLLNKINIFTNNNVFLKMKMTNTLYLN